MFNYWGFGLYISSEIDLPDLRTVPFDVPDLTIRLGNTPVRLAGKNTSVYAGTLINECEYLLDLKGVAVYYCRGQKEVIVHPYPGADSRSISLFLISNAIPAILYQRNMILLHASAIQVPDGLVMFFGRPGSGKSTIIRALIEKGYNLFSDDMCLLRYSNVMGSPIEVVATLPVVNLWEDSFSLLGLDIPDKNCQIRPGLNKYKFLYQGSFNRKPQKALLGYVLNPAKDTDQIEIESNTKVRAFLNLQKSTYCFPQINGMRKQQLHFSILSQLAGSSPFFTASRPMENHSFEHDIEIIEKHFLTFLP